MMIAACEIYGFLGGVLGLCSINTLCWISVDRYFVIAKPFYTMRHISHKRAALQLVCVWLWAIVLSVIPLLGFGPRYIPEGFQISCSFDYLTLSTVNIVYVWSLFVGGFFLPVAIIIISYCGIVKAVADQANMMKKTAESMGAKTTKDDGKKEKQELKTAKIAAGTITLFILSWLPYAIVSMLGILGYDEFVNPYTTMIPVLFAKASATWNPILYSLSHPRFR
jgi:r-opsin